MRRYEHLVRRDGQVGAALRDERTGAGRDRDVNSVTYRVYRGRRESVSYPPFPILPTKYVVYTFPETLVRLDYLSITPARARTKDSEMSVMVR